MTRQRPPQRFTTKVIILSPRLAPAMYVRRRRKSPLLRIGWKLVPGEQVSLPGEEQGSGLTLEKPPARRPWCFAE